MLQVVVSRACTWRHRWDRVQPRELPPIEGIVASSLLSTVSTEHDKLQRVEELFKVWSPAAPSRWSSDNSLFASIDTLLHHLQQQGIVVQDIDGIVEYLQQFPDMIEVTDRVLTIAQQRLSSAKFVLTLYVDPEIDDRSLVVYARTTRYDESFIQQLEQVGEASDRYLAYTQGWLQVTTDFAPPE